MQYSFSRNLVNRLMKLSDDALYDDRGCHRFIHVYNFFKKDEVISKLPRPFGLYRD
ncbi:hypothetical protein JPSP3_13420 [Staphylococcus pseudintermedius]